MSYRCLLATLALLFISTSEVLALQHAIRKRIEIGGRKAWVIDGLITRPDLDATLRAIKRRRLNVLRGWHSKSLMNSPQRDGSVSPWVHNCSSSAAVQAAVDAATELGVCAAAGVVLSCTIEQARFTDSELRSRGFLHHATDWMSAVFAKNSSKPNGKGVNYNTTSLPIGHNSTHFEAGIRISLVDEWAANWGGELLLFGNSSERLSEVTSTSVVLPKPGRVVIFDSEMEVAVRPPSVSARSETLKHIEARERADVADKIGGVQVISKEERERFITYQLQAGKMVTLNFRLLCKRGPVVGGTGTTANECVRDDWTSCDPPLQPGMDIYPVLSSAMLGTSTMGNFDAQYREGDELGEEPKVSQQTIWTHPHKKAAVFDHFWSASLQESMASFITNTLNDPTTLYGNEKSGRFSLDANSRAVELDRDICVEVAQILQVDKAGMDFFPCTGPVYAQRCYVNYQTFVDWDEPHVDGPGFEEANLTFTGLAYMHDRWKTSWAGETVLMSEVNQENLARGGFAEIAAQVLPLPRRLLLFHSNMLHFARAATIDAHPFESYPDHQGRASLAFKLSCPCAPEVLTSYRQSEVGIDADAALLKESLVYRLE